MNATHTPTPWNEPTNYAGRFEIGTDRRIAIVDTLEDAKFIRAACNAHDDLMAALRSARKNFWIVREYAKGVDVQHAIEEIDTALAKAGAA